MLKPLCFVLMPFGSKTAPDGREIDFDEIYRRLIHPAIEAAELDPIRADEENLGGVIHKPMLERLAMCEYALADLTTANANVFYELGVRHALRPAKTLLIFAQGYGLPFDVASLRAIPYRLGRQGVIRVPETIRAMARHLESARQAHVDSSVFQFLDDLKAPVLAHEKTDVFQDRVDYAADRKLELARAREARDVAAVQQIERELGRLDDVEAGVAIDLMLSYRALKEWEEVIRVVGELSRPLQRRTLVQEQLGFALNRSGRSDEAIRVLDAVLEKRGPSSETLGILGRVYKDRWDAAQTGSKKRPAEAAGWLDRAIETYRRGFEADWRDAYPGINTVTLMELADPPKPEREQLLPVVTYSVQRKIKAGQPDYWDWATLLELAVLRNDKKDARTNLEKALAAVRESWEPETTANNLDLIRRARKNRGDKQRWLKDIIEALRAAK